MILFLCVLSTSTSTSSIDLSVSAARITGSLHLGQTNCIFLPSSRSIHTLQLCDPHRVMCKLAMPLMVQRNATRFFILTIFGRSWGLCGFGKENAHDWLCLPPNNYRNHTFRLPLLSVLFFPNEKDTLFVHRSGSAMKDTVHCYSRKR